MNNNLIVTQASSTGIKASMPNKERALLKKMSSKELGTLLTCLMPLARVDDMRYMIGVESKSIVIK